MHLSDAFGSASVKFHVLVLDDDAAESRRLGDALRHARHGVSISFVSAPTEAMRFLHGEGEFKGRVLPDLVLLDYRMPSNGGRVLSLMKGDPNLRAVPVVVFSVGASAEDIKHIYDCHANCCIDQPMNVTDLSEDLRVALSFWLDTAMVRGRGAGRAA